VVQAVAALPAEGGELPEAGVVVDETGAGPTKPRMPDRNKIRIIMTIVQLSSVNIPEKTGLSRVKPARSEILDESFWGSYDSKTLFYDVVFDATRKRLRLYSPRLWGLEKDVRGSTFLVDGVVQSHHRFLRGKHLDIIEFNNIETANTLSVKMREATWSQSINHTDPLTVGASGVVTLSKNNKLAWIRDWALFYVNEHGADTVVVADNGSTDYTLEDIHAALDSIHGLDHVRVISAPFPFGPNSQHCSRWSEAMFLQAAILNISLDRFFGNDAVMLSVDIDELVMSRKGKSVFDATRKSMFGHITFEGRWVHSKSSGDQTTHRDHVWTKQVSDKCPTKYAISSRSPFRRFQLQVHNIAHVDRNVFKSRRDFYFLHCKQISTSWKYNRDASTTEGLCIDEDVRDHMRRVFSD
jgi:hypothetical protein